MKIKFFVLHALMLLSLSCALSACNTTEGMGRDMEQTGRNIQEGVQDIKN